METIEALTEALAKFKVMRDTVFVRVVLLLQVKIFGVFTFDMPVVVC